MAQLKVQAKADQHACDCRILRLSQETTHAFTLEETPGPNALHATEHSKTISLVASASCKLSTLVCRPHIYAGALRMCANDQTYDSERHTFVVCFVRLPALPKSNLR